MFDSKHLGLQSPKVPRTPKKIFNVNDGNKENVFSENSSNSSLVELQRMKSEYEKVKSQLSNETTKNKKLALTMQTEMEKSKLAAKRMTLLEEENLLLKKSQEDQKNKFKQERANLIQSLNQQVSTLQGQLKDLTSQTLSPQKHHDTEIKLEPVLASPTKTKHCESCEFLETRVKVLTTEFEKAALAYNSQKTLCGQLKRSNETLTKEKEELSNSVASVQQLGDHLQVAIETLTAKLSNEHGLNQQLEFKIKDLELKLEHANQLNEQFSEQNSQLEAEFSETISRYNELASEYTQFRDEIEQGSIEENILNHLFEVTVDDLRSTRDNQQKEISSLNARIGEMEEEKAQLVQLYEEDKAQAIEEEKANLMLSFQASKKFFEEKEQELSDRLHVAMDRNEFLEQDLTEFEHEIQEKVKEKIQLENDLESLKEQQQSLETQVVNYSSEKSHMQQEERLSVAIFETVVESYKNRLEKSERELDLFKNKLVDEFVKFHKLNQEQYESSLNNLKNEIKIKKDQNRHLMNEVKYSSEQYLEMHKIFEEEYTAMEKLNKNLIEQTDLDVGLILKALTEQFRREKEELLEKYQQEKYEKESQVRKLEEEKAQKEQQLQQFEQEKEEKEMQLRRLEEEKQQKEQQLQFLAEEKASHLQYLEVEKDNELRKYENEKEETVQQLRKLEEEKNEKEYQLQIISEERSQQLQQYEQEKEEKDQQIQTLKEEKAQREQQIQYLEQEKENQVRQLQDENSLLQQLNEEKVQKLQKLAEETEQLRKLEDEKEEKEQQLQRCLEKIEEKDQQLQKLAEEKEQKEQQLQYLEQEKEKRFQQFQEEENQELRKYEEEREEIVQKLQQYEVKIEEKDNQLKKLKEEKEEQEEQVRKLQELKEEKEQQLQKLGEEKESQDQLLRQLEDEKEKAIAEERERCMLCFEGKQQLFERKSKELSLEIESRHVLNLSLQKEIQEMSALCKQLQEENAQNKYLEERIKQQESFEPKLKEYEAAIQSKNEIIISLENELQVLREELANKIVEDEDEEPQPVLSPQAPVTPSKRDRVTQLETELQHSIDNLKVLYDEYQSHQALHKKLIEENEAQKQLNFWLVQQNVTLDKDLKELKSEQKQIQDEVSLQNFKLKLEQELEMSKINAAVNDELVQKTKKKLELLQKEHESLKLLENLARHSLEQNTIALQESEEKLNYLIDENYELREFLSEQSKKSESFDALLAEIKSEADKAKEENQAMSVKMGEVELAASQQVEAARIETQKAQSRAEEMQNQLEAARSEFEHTRAQNEEMKSQLTATQSLIESLRSQIEAAQSDLAKSNVSSQLFDEKVNELTRIIEEKQTLIASLEDALNQLKNQFKEEAENWSLKVQSLEKENEQLRALENSSKLMLEESKKAIRELEASHQETKRLLQESIDMKECTRDVTQLKDANAKIELLKKELNDSFVRLTILHEDYKNANERAEHYKALNEEGEKQLLDLMKFSSPSINNYSPSSSSVDESKMMNLIEEATQREQERFEAREKAIISESEEKLQKKEEMIAILKKEIEALSEEKESIIAEKMKIEGEVKLQQKQNEKLPAKEETPVASEDAEDIRKTIAFMKHSLSINTRELERMKGLVKARDDIISQLKATQEELLEFEHVNVQLKEILAQRDKEFNVVMQKNKKLQLQLQAMQDESLKSKQTNSELSALQDQLEDALLHMKILNENNALQEKEINRLLIIEAEKAVGTTDQQRKENFLKMKKEINALKAENSKLQETQYQQSRKIASTAPRTSTSTTTTSRFQSSIQKK